VTERIGDVNVVSYWLTGTESEAEIAAIKNRMMDYREDIGTLRRLQFGEPRWSERKPGSEGYPVLPDPPDHIQGPNVRCLIAESEIIGRYSPIERVTFTGTLTKEQLARGRAQVRAAAQGAGMFNWDDNSCDMYIDSLPYEIAAKVCGVRQWLGKT
jgi:hypothetical protein